MKEQAYITAITAADVTDTIGNKIFTATFTKRTTGERRTMNARLNVKKHLANGQATYDFVEKKQLPVFDLTKKAYRSIPLDGDLQLTVGGHTYHVAS